MRVSDFVFLYSYDFFIHSSYYTQQKSVFLFFYVHKKPICAKLQPWCNLPARLGEKKDLVYMRRGIWFLDLSVIHYKLTHGQSSKMKIGGIT